MITREQADKFMKIRFELMRDGTEGAHRLLGESLDRTGGSTKTTTDGEGMADGGPRVISFFPAVADLLVP